MTSNDSILRFSGNATWPDLAWQGERDTVAFDAAGQRDRLLDLDSPCYVVRHQGQSGLSNAGQVMARASLPASAAGLELVASAPPLPPGRLGDPAFLAAYGLRLAYMAGSMANGISGEDLVIALGKAGILASFGAGGLLPERITAAIHAIQRALPHGPYAFNLIHNHSEEALERQAVELYLKYEVRVVEASAFLDLTPHVVRYRVAGLGLDAAQRLQVKNKVIAKLSRREVAVKFMQPAPPDILNHLLEQKLISELQARLAAQIPMADDVSVEADSGGHTDNRPLVCLLPSMLALRDEMQEKYRYDQPIRVGAAGGIGTPASALGALMMGAAYVVTGSVNQACLEAGTSAYVKKLLAQAEMPDVAMAPSADMFEMGGKIQALKKGVFFPMRASKLFELYRTCDSLDAIPPAEKEKLEKQVFKCSIEAVWEECVAFFSRRDPEQLTRAADNPKRKMALVFRWYLGQASRWAVLGEKGREMDYQIWCGPAMGAFNDWVRGSYLAEPERRGVLDVARAIMTGAAFLYRLADLKAQGLHVPLQVSAYRPLA